jgi:hypothetical protein
MSNLVECSDCGKEISKQAKACPHCGAPPPKPVATTEQQLKAWVVILAVAGMLWYFFGDPFGSGGSSSSSTTTETVGREFSSIKSCLSSIETNAGPLKIVKDTHEEILGRTAAGHLFACTREDTGSRGTYYSGWYVVDK